MAATAKSQDCEGGGGGAGADDRVMATAQQILKSLNAPKDVREDMLLILSSFDNRLSKITDLIHTSSATEDRFESAEKVILRWDATSSSPPWEDSPDEAAEFLAALDEILQLCENLSVQNDKHFVDRADAAIQHAMTRLEDEFRLILVRNTVPLDADRLYSSIHRVLLSFASHEGEISEEFESFGNLGNGSSSCFHERGGSLGGEVSVDLINPHAVADLREIAERMTRAGYEKECCQAYTSVRREALDECLVVLGVERLSIEEVQKIEWRDLDEKMKKWVQATKITVRVLLPCEKRLGDQVFMSSDHGKDICFNETAKCCVMQLLNFGEAVSIGIRSPEKLFRMLDMYEALRDMLPDLQAMVTDDLVLREAEGVLDTLGEAARATFAEFENAVKRETSRKPMLFGEIHPLTRYVMNYLKLVVVYSETLNLLLEGGEDEPNNFGGDDSGKQESECMSPLATHLLSLISSLESNLEEKSKFYEDNAMQYIFLMNNILYIVQKVKDSELRTHLGDIWIRKHRAKVRQYATSYLRASWSKALSCLKDEGLGGSASNASRVALKDRFKNFNTCFEEIYRVQTAWKVPDEQLRDELRISISERVIPAYRSFVGRFGSQLESGRNVGKYIKYTPEDLENYLLDLFEGMPRVLHHLRRKSS